MGDEQSERRERAGVCSRMDEEEKKKLKPVGEDARSGRARLAGSGDGRELVVERKVVVASGWKGSA